VKTFSEWKLIETAPRDGTWVLLAGGVCELEENDSNPRPVVAQWTTVLNDRQDPNYGRWQFAWYDGGYYGTYKDPTHWMPAPAVPTRVTPD